MTDERAKSKEPQETRENHARGIQTTSIQTDTLTLMDYE